MVIKFNNIIHLPDADEMNEGSTTPVSSLVTEAHNLQQQKALSALKALGGADKAQDKKMWEAAKGFESMFLAQMYKSMRKTLPENEFNKASNGRKIFTEMLDGEYAKMASGKSENGLAGMIYRQLMLMRKMGSENTISSQKLTKLYQPDHGTVPVNTGDKVRLSNSQLEPMVRKASEKYGVDINLIKSVIQQESAGRPYAQSKAGAKGLMQLMDSTATEMGVRNSFDPEDNIMGGTRYLDQLIKRYKGDEKLVLAAYNAGPGTVNRYGGIPPYPETQSYIDKVSKTRNEMNSKETGGQNEHGNAP